MCSSPARACRFPGSWTSVATLAVLLTAATPAPAQRPPVIGSAAPKPPVEAGTATGEKAPPGPPSTPAPRPDAALGLEAALRKRLGEPMPELDLDLVMFGEDFFGAAPENVRFSDFGDAILFSWKRWDEERRGTWRFELSTGNLERLPDDEPAPASGKVAPDLSFRVVASGHALRLETREPPSSREILRLAAPISDLTLAHDLQGVYFRSGDGLYRLGLARGELTQLLAFAVGPEPKEPGAEEKKDPKTDFGAWHEAEQRSLFRVLYERLERDLLERKQRRAREKREPRVPTSYRPEGFEIRGIAISPAGTHAAVSLWKPGKKPRVADMPDYVTTDGFTAVRPTRLKVGGDLDGERRFEVVVLADGRRIEVKAPAPTAVPGGARWSPDGRQLLASAATTNDERGLLLKIDLATGEAHILHEVRDPAWVLRGGFDVQWLGESSRGVFISEASDWMMPWLVDAETGNVRRLVNGRFEVTRLFPTPDGRKLYALATPTSPHVRDLVEIDPDSGALTVLTADGGGRDCVLSPDGKRVAETRSFANRPPELVVRELEGTAPPLPVTDSPSPAFASYGRFLAPEIVHVPASDGVAVPARIYRPEKREGAPAVLFVHGAGYLQNVHRWWSQYEREYAFHHWLRERGFVVLDVDYRGSAGYGRDWRTAIRLHMGGRDLDDYVDAARWLVEHEGVAKDRIGIYGGSYGGFLTLMGLFTKPGVFRAGAALRPVTDWAHYNDGYTSNILDTPLESPEAFRRSSPIYFAEGLSDHLLVCHGLLDDNVHAQDTVRLTQRLIELRKKDFEVAYYPLENHGFRDPASWSDEYRRIAELFLRVLRPGAERR